MFVILQNAEMKSVCVDLITCLHWGAEHGRLWKVVDLAGAKGLRVEQPTQEVQGTQAASLLVSMAKRRVWGGVPILALTMYVGLCVICLPEAIGTIDLLATKLQRYCILAWSLASSCRTLSSHERPSEGRNGEQGLNTWNTLRVEPWSWTSQLGFSALAREKRRKSSRGVSIGEVFMVMAKVQTIVWLVPMDSVLYIYTYIVKNLVGTFIISRKILCDFGGVME